MDPRSLDVAVQKALLSLYPPFDVTAPTVLSQLFRLLDSDYHGDGLCCLLDFLIPAKRLFERVAGGLPAPYLNCIFLHEGWPLCLHEKVVVHLAPLNPLLLRPGDFYLQAEPYGEQSACLTVKCLSRDLRTVEERLVPESSHALLFTSHWLEEVNHALSGAPLHTCLVATEKGVAPLPWSQIATPEFIHKPTVAPGPTQLGASLLAHALGLSSAAVPEDPASQSGTGSLGLADAPRLHGNIPGTVLDGQDGPERSGQGKYPGLIKVDQASPRKKPSAFVVPSPCDREGDYVDLLEWTEEVKLEHLATSGPSHGQPGPSGETPVSSASKPRLPTGTRGTAAEKWPGGKGQSSEEGPCTPLLRRKLPRDPKVPGPRCRYRESYVAAIRNPVNLGSGLMAAILEESHVPRQAFPVAGRPRENPAPAMQGLDQAAAPRLLSGFPRKAEPQATNAEEGTRQGYSKLLRSPAGAVRNLPRSQSPPASHKFSFFKGQRQAAAPGAGVSGASQHEGPRKRMSALYSPRVSRAKAAGKDYVTQPTFFSAPSQHETPNTTGSSSLQPLTGASPQRDASRQQGDSGAVELLSTAGVKTLSVCFLLAAGSTDKLGRALIQVSTSSSAWEATWCSAPAVAQLLLYLCSIPRRDARARGLTVLVDARRQPPAPALHAAIRAVQSAAPASIRGVLLLAERGHPAPQRQVPAVLVEVLPSLRALGRHVDRTQLTPDLDGTFPYCHDEWVQFFQKLHPFVADLQQASKLLQSSIQELEEGDLPADSQVTTCNQLQMLLPPPPKSSLGILGGAAAALLSRDGLGRPVPFSALRNSLDSALGLYSRVEEDVHALVTKSNRCLERLELLRQIRELEAEFSKLSCWLEEGDSRLRELSSEEWNPQNPESSSQRFKEFFLQA
uniref:KIAA1755 n=1 Tax=Pelodiscus sinensis TaxID=13735 RepID=K7FBZ9_PELSI